MLGYTHLLLGLLLVDFQPFARLAILLEEPSRQGVHLGDNFLGNPSLVELAS